MLAGAGPGFIIAACIIAVISRPTWKLVPIVVGTALVVAFVSFGLFESPFLGPIIGAIACGFILRKVRESQM